MTAELWAVEKSGVEDAPTEHWDPNYQSVHVDWSADAGEHDTEVTVAGHAFIHATTPGAIIFSRYQVIDRIGRGGTGVVVRARDGRIGRDVAVKLLKPELAKDPLQVDRFLREARAMLALRGDHAARVLDFGTLPDGTPAMVMELLEGQDLSRVLGAHGPQHPTTVVGWMLQVCEGLAEAHALGIIHRDIKLSNLVLTRGRDGDERVKLVDFGTSKLNDPLEEPTGAAAVLGTPPYMAPEHLRHSRDVDQRSDIWSLGVVMYRLLSGRMPFEPESISHLRKAIQRARPPAMDVPLPAGLGDVVLQCLETDPARRFQNVADLAFALGRFARYPSIGWASAERARRLLGSQMPSSLVATPAPAVRPRRPTPRVLTVGSSRAAMSFRSAGIIMLTAAAVIGTVAGAFAGRETRANASPAHVEAPVPAPPPPEPLPPEPPPPVATLPVAIAPPVPAVEIVVPVRAAPRHRAKRHRREPATKSARASKHDRSDDDDDDLFAERR